jgi:hypothetical protein
MRIDRPLSARGALASLLFLLPGCPSTPIDSSGMDGSSTTCTYDFVCMDGACACSSRTATCCDPAICGETSPSSCRVVCEVCTCSGACGDAGPTPRDVGRGSDAPGARDAGVPPTGCTVLPSACWDECGADHGTCATRCGPGARCWGECGADHGTCAMRCGPGCACWDACGADHGTCATRCGAGVECWAACGADHGTCATRCGPGAECWDACGADHGTCATRCGPGADCWAACGADHGTCATRCGPGPECWDACGRE